MHYRRSEKREMTESLRTYSGGQCRFSDCVSNSQMTRALGVVRETARLLAAERLRAPDEAGVLAFPVRKFAFGRADTWFRVDRG